MNSTRTRPTCPKTRAARVLASALAACSSKTSSIRRAAGADLTTRRSSWPSGSCKSSSHPPTSCSVAKVARSSRLRRAVPARRLFPTTWARPTKKRWDQGTRAMRAAAVRDLASSRSHRASRRGWGRSREAASRRVVASLATSSSRRTITSPRKTNMRPIFAL